MPMSGTVLVMRRVPIDEDVSNNAGTSARNAEGIGHINHLSFASNS